MGHPGDMKWLMTKPTAGLQTGQESTSMRVTKVEYWSKELGISPDRLRELVAKHGVMAADIRRVLGK